QDQVDHVAHGQGQLASPDQIRNLLWRRRRHRRRKRQLNRTGSLEKILHEIGADLSARGNRLGSYGEHGEQCDKDSRTFHLGLLKKQTNVIVIRSEALQSDPTTPPYERGSNRRKYQ